MECGVKRAFSICLLQCLLWTNEAHIGQNRAHCLHANTLCIDLIPSDTEVSKWNKSRWPSYCTDFHSHCVNLKNVSLLVHSIKTKAAAFACIRVSIPLLTTHVVLGQLEIHKNSSMLSGKPNCWCLIAVLPYGSFRQKICKVWFVFFFRRHNDKLVNSGKKTYSIDSFLITWWPWKPVQLDGHLDWFHFDTSQSPKFVHAHALCIDHDMIPSDSEVSKCNRSRWPSNCTGFHGHHVMRKESILRIDGKSWQWL